VLFSGGVLPVELARMAGSRARYEWRNRRGRTVPEYRLVPSEPV